MDFTASSAYGFKSWNPNVPGGIAIAAETQIGQGNELSGAVMGKLPLGLNNPLFWLLLLFLVFTGWMYFGASLGVKRVGSASVKVGK